MLFTPAKPSSPSSSPQPNCCSPSTPSRFRIELAHSLGFAEYPADPVAAPYLNYIENRRRGLGTSDDYLDLFRRVVLFFQDPTETPGTQNEDDRRGRTRATLPNKCAPQPTIRTFISMLSRAAAEPLFASAPVNSTFREELIADTIIYILGVWTMMLGCFVQLPAGHRQVEVAYCIRQGEAESRIALEETPEGLLRGSGLLPSKEEGRGMLKGRNGSGGVGEAFQGLLEAMVSGMDGALQNSPADRKLRSAIVSYIAAANRSTQAHVSAFPSSLDARSPYATSAIDLHSSLDVLEAASVKSATLNACTLSSLAGVRIHWTANLSRHLLISSRASGPVLELFALPCIFRGARKSLQASGLPADLVQEIQESYSLLFNTASPTPLHAWMSRVLGLRRWCWCWSCSGRRLREHEMNRLKREPLGEKWGSDTKSEFDPHLAMLITMPAQEDWSYELFPNLWSRISALEEHLHKAKPWNFWVLFRDRRDTLQFWTFL